MFPPSSQLAIYRYLYIHSLPCIGLNPKQMAHNLGDPEFWLPPMFLSDDSVSDFNNTELLVSDSNSGFSSPLDSSTETESDEDEFLNELTRRLTNSINLCPHIWKPKPNHGLLPCDKADTLWKTSKSPQSELAKRTRLQQETSRGYLQFRATPQKLCLNSVPSNTNNHEYHSNQGILYQPLDQNGNGNGNGRAVGLSPSAWPSLQQSQPHKQPFHAPWTSPAILMNSNFPKRECSGTGVFLPMPRHVATTPGETPRKKQSAAAKQRNVATQSQQRRDNKSGTVKNEIRLPQEWTY
ncbi:uncharacterized protein LOC141708135 isoform X2 [Apium graveolens]|uniref:uncharacterized protein LOC141708135 isoform X2 n=1 Tax=Apium graveolens TaxID=4045 RepID=UPI003D7AA3F1